MIEENDQSGFGERPQAGFANVLDSRVAFYRFALTIYDFRCAISGLRFAPQEQVLHDRLDVVPIHPRELGGPLEIGNMLVLESGLAALFGQGLITASDDGLVVVPRPEKLSAQQREMVVPGRALLLPLDPLFQPLAKHLHFHRLTIAQYQ